MNRFALWLDQASHWRNLRSIGGSSLAKATGIIPLLGALLLYNYNILHLLELFGRSDRTCEWGKCIPFWNTHLLYFGSCSIAAATATYGWRCPERVKKYGSSVEYTTAELEFFRHGTHRRDYPGLVREDAIKFGLDISDVLLTVGKHNPHMINEGQVLPLMAKHYELLNVCRKGSRVTALILYLLGFILILIPTASTFIKVVLEVMGRMLP